MTVQRFILVAFYIIDPYNYNKNIHAFTSTNPNKHSFK